MAITASNFTIERNPDALGRHYLVTGTFTGPTSYTASGEVLTNALFLAVTGFRECLFLQFTPPMSPAQALYCGWDATPVANTSQGKVRFFNAGESAHLHNLLVSGGVTLASNDHLGTQGGRLSQPGTGTTITSVDGASGVQNAAARVTSDEVASTTNLSTFTCRFFALVR